MNFQEVGTGRTWWSGREGFAAVPSPARVRLGEAIGEGDLETVQQVVDGWTGEALDRPLANGVTPLQFAGQYRRPDIAGWLLSRGAEPDVLALWDLGWRDEARDVLRRAPSVVRARRPRSGKTLLHMAVERNDPDLAIMLLRMGADPRAQDNRYGSTPEEWAIVLRRTRLAATLRAVAAEMAGAGSG
jgi:ankyrin repeat protein